MDAASVDIRLEKFATESVRANGGGETNFFDLAIRVVANEWQ